MKFMIIILGIIIPHICCNKALFDALDKALRNDSNLYELHRILYPGSFQVSSTVLMVEAFTVGNITDLNVYGGTPGFIRCDYDLYCFNMKNDILEFRLSVNTESNSHSRLLSFINDNQLYLEFIDYVSYKLFSFLTLSQLESRYSEGSINLAIDELQEMPDYDGVVADLESVLGWVSL